MTGTSPQQETVLVLESLQKSLREVPPPPPKIDQKLSCRKKQIVVPHWKITFSFFEGIGPQLQFQILAESKRADPCFGVCPNSAWSPSYDFFSRKLLKSEPPRRRGITRVLLGITRGLLGEWRLPWLATQYMQANGSWRMMTTLLAVVRFWANDQVQVMSKRKS